MLTVKSRLWSQYISQMNTSLTKALFSFLESSKLSIQVLKDSSTKDYRLSIHHQLESTLFRQTPTAHLTTKQHQGAKKGKRYCLCSPTWPGLWRRSNRTSNRVVDRKKWLTIGSQDRAGAAIECGEVQICMSKRKGRWWEGRDRGNGRGKGWQERRVTWERERQRRGYPMELSKLWWWWVVCGGDRWVVKGGMGREEIEQVTLTWIERGIFLAL